VATLAVAMPATARFGLEGFLWGWLFSNVVLTAGYLLMLARVGRSQQGVSLQRVLSNGWHAHRELIVLEMQQSARLAA